MCWSLMCTNDVKVMCVASRESPRGEDGMPGSGHQDSSASWKQFKGGNAKSGTHAAHIVGPPNCVCLKSYPKLYG